MSSKQLCPLIDVIITNSLKSLQTIFLAFSTMIFLSWGRQTGVMSSADMYTLRSTRTSTFFITSEMSLHVKLPLVSLHSSLLPLFLMHLRQTFPYITKITNIQTNTSLIFLDGTGMAGNLFLEVGSFKNGGECKIRFIYFKTVSKSKEKKRLLYLLPKNYSLKKIVNYFITPVY